MTIDITPFLFMPMSELRAHINRCVHQGAQLDALFEALRLLRDAANVNSDADANRLGFQTVARARQRATDIGQLLCEYADAVRAAGELRFRTK